MVTIFDRTRDSSAAPEGETLQYVEDTATSLPEIADEDRDGEDERSARKPLRLLTRRQILDADDTQEEYLEVPEWGGWVRIIGITGIERDRYEKSVVTTNKKGQAEFNVMNVRAKLVALSVVDEGGKRVFSDDDARALGQKSAAALERVYEVAARLARITKQDEDDLAKNSRSDLDGGLPFA